jgi:hypothetical protein
MKQPDIAVNLDTYRAAGPAAQARLLENWIGDDARRAELFRACPGGLVLNSPANGERVDQGRQPAPVWLVTDPTLIEAALRQPQRYSNSPYAELGTGTFMLALDHPPRHAQPERSQHPAQRSALAQALRYSAEQVSRLAAEACEAALVISMRGPRFDAVEYAENAALRFSSALFGFTLADHPVLETALRAAYKALSYQFIGRHLATDPLAIPQANQQMAAVMVRAQALIEEYWRGARLSPPELPVGLEPFATELPGFTTVMQRFADDQRLGMDSEELAVLVIGAMSGTVGNVQAAASIALRSILSQDSAEQMRALRAAARDVDPKLGPACRNFRTLWVRVLQALRENPPVAFLHRRLTEATELEGMGHLHKDTVLVLAMGALTHSLDTAHDAEKLEAAVFGLHYGQDGPDAPNAMHSCIGKYLAKPLIVEIVRRVLLLPGVEEALDAQDGSVLGLQKAWGFRCLAYPLSYRHDRRLAQQPLNVSMRIKAPIEEHAAKLRRLIPIAAPRIERLLRRSRHVHFAWFEFVESGTHLLLHTVYDGDFATYVEHFALDAGDLFDLLFEHIEDAPPRPVREHPQEFVALIARYNRPPAAGYFFSAYPRLEARDITRADRSAP